VSAELTRVDVADLDLATAGELAAIDNAALDGVPLRHHTAETFLLQCRDRNGEGPDAGFWLAHEGGRLVGYAALTLNLFENLDGAKILGAVHPDHRRRGIGRALMAALARACRADGGSYLFWNALERNQAARAFYQRIGACEERVVTLSLQQDALVRLAEAG
jgi:ribosomal protein S18 acetylase RimI-like enzyme